MDASPAKSPENMTSTELKAHLAAPAVTTPKTKAATKRKAKSKPAPKAKSKPAAKSKSKPARKAKVSKAPKASKAKRPAKVPAVRQIAAFMVENKGKAFKSTDLAKKFKARPVEIHRAVALLERAGATVEASRSGPTQKPGRRAFLYTVTKAPAAKPAKSKAK